MVLTLLFFVKFQILTGLETCVFLSFRYEEIVGDKP